MKRLAVTVTVAAVLLLSSNLAASQWCVCKQDAPQAALQKTIDYACGAGADCNPIHETGACYNPNNVPAHCSWAANSYYQNNKARGATCDFTGTATLIATDPSTSGCSYPTSASAAGTSTPTTGGGTTGGTPGTGTFTPGAGTGGTTGTGMGTGATGTGMGGLGPTNTGLDTAAAGTLPRSGLALLAASFIAVVLSTVAFA